MKKFTVKSGKSLNIQGESGVICVISIDNVTEPDTVPKVQFKLTVDGILRQEGVFNVGSELDLTGYTGDGYSGEIASITLSDVENASETIIVLGLN